MILLAVSTGAQAQTTAKPQLPQLPGRLFGLTIDSIGDFETVKAGLREVRGLAPNNPRPIVRIVLDMDPGVDRVNPDYFNAIKELHDLGLAYVMVELVDSESETSAKCISKTNGIVNPGKSRELYRKRAQAYFDYVDKKSKEPLKKYVDIWEIGNEINTDWFGGLENMRPKDRRALILSMVAEAYKVFVDEKKNIKKALTAVTFYFNDDGTHHSYPHPDYSMKTWIHEGQRYFKKVDYVLISYYEDDNFDGYITSDGHTIRKAIVPEYAEWAGIFYEIKQAYRESKFGFGEFGPQCHYPLEGSCDVIDPDVYGEEPNLPSEARENTCPKAFTAAALEFKDTSDGLWKRICSCCRDKQVPYIQRYYSVWHSGIIDAIRAAHGDTLASDFVGGYFYWHFNPDVLDKFTFANIDKYPTDERTLRRHEAETTLRGIKEAYRDYRF